MSRVTQKFSTILVSAGDRMATFKSIAEMPPSLRKKLLESTSGVHAATLLIADDRGRQEILKSLHGEEGGIDSRVVASLAKRQADRRQEHWLLSWRHAAEIALVGGIGLCLWLLAAWR